MIQVSDFDNGAAEERTELAPWVADRHHCEGLNILRYPEHGLYLILTPNMVRSNGSAEAERPAGEYNVPVSLDKCLHRGYARRRPARWQSSHECLEASLRVA